MKLERITLENFRQYFGPHRLMFAKEKQRKVTVIHGVNGAGKTSLFLAINWCLYGSEYVNNVGELISKEAISRANAGECVEMFVELSFLHDGERYLAKRSRSGVKMIDATLQKNTPDEFTIVRIHGDGQSERIKNPIGTINAILPSNIRTYFLFDGEKIDDFAKPESAKQVKEAIYLVFKLEILDRARKHLEGLAGEYRKDLQKASSGELRDLVEKNEQARHALEEYEQRRSEIEAEIESINSKIEDIGKQLLNIQDAQILQNRYDLIKRELKQRHAELDNIISMIKDIAVIAYFIAAQFSIDEALKILEAKRERGEIPSNIRKQFIQDLISQMRCICGRSFTEGSSEHHQLLSLMNTTLPDSLGDEVLEISATLRTLKERSAMQYKNLEQYMKQRADLIDVINGLEAEESDVRRQLKNSPLEEVSRLERQRREFEADKENYNRQLGKLSGNIENLTKYIAQLDKDIAKAKKEEQKEKMLGMKLYLAQKAADEIRDKYRSYADDMRKKIEAKTKEIFKRLIWKDSYFQDIRLDQDFNLEVIDQYGKPARPELSAGERQVLSLSFITAMARTSEEEAPLVMDTPFGRLSSQHRSNITANLPTLADQLILLVTDEELRDQARANLEPYIGEEYHLSFNKHTSCTSIEEGAGIE